ncbi:hypothetical protein HAX54_014632 [Datura stramonium]|uniref:Uncharacterized protein n=1 Tax=Datura stramonium TaxID=4076 RepID=A0ABS8TR42_DATST|nr:hypothetical protein [Datura stramonium]
MLPEEVGEARSNDEGARRSHRAGSCDGAETSQSLQDKITQFNNLSKRLTEHCRAALNEAKAKYVHLLKLQDSLFRQKAKTSWLKDRDKKKESDQVWSFLIKSGFRSCG